ncbi:MAG TPA: DUF6247 family protein [Streptosporangiaceae bacterium]|nr:DUF6247 family protein [Streptosporangiaceae bacterium]
MSSPALLPDDPEDPQVILRDLPERERDTFLAQYREAAEGSVNPAGYQRLRQVLHIWSLAVIACNSPGYYDRTSSGGIREPGIPAEEVFPDWNERIEAARTTRA